jgi:chaperonin GroES
MAAKKKKMTKKSAAKKSSAKKPAMKKSASTAKSPVARQVSAAPKAKPDLTSFLTPLDDRILVQPDEALTQTAGGLFIPDSAAERPSRGTVMAKGRGRRNKKGQLRPLDVNVGDQVLYAEYAGTKINFSNATVLILREEDILGIVT